MTKPSNHKLDPNEVELPETMYVSDIEDRVFKSIVLQCLSEVEGIGLIDRTFIGSLLGRDGVEGLKGVSIEQDGKKQSISVKIEVTIQYGVPIPEKAEEIQRRVSTQITHMTGLHVSCVHVVFKNSVQRQMQEKEQQPVEAATS